MVTHTKAILPRAVGYFPGNTIFGFQMVFHCDAYGPYFGSRLTSITSLVNK